MAVTTLLVGCGRLGGAILSGWRLAGAVEMPSLGVLTPSAKPLTGDAAADGAQINPQDFSAVSRVVLAVKPAKWREAAQGFLAQLPADAVIISVMAGVSISRLAETFGARAIARVMPTTAVSAAAGVAACFATGDNALKAAHALFEPIATVVDVASDDLVDVATALSGSGAAYAYAFVRDLAEAGVRQGLTQDQAIILSRLTVAGALTRMRAGEPNALIAEVASPGGTTEAGLRVLEPELEALLDRTVVAALARARRIGD